MSLDDFKSYQQRLGHALGDLELEKVDELKQDLTRCWKDHKQVFVCGNGGSAANATHVANDFVYGVGRGSKPGLKIHALTANSSVLTCLANDEGYDQVFSRQLLAAADSGDVLIALSGSGNSANIVKVLQQARELGVKSYAILGFMGGESKALADVAIHTPIEDMQISEDIQLMIFHMICQSMMKEA